MKPLTPKIIQMPAARVAAVHSVGDPNVVGERTFPALYGCVCTLKFDLKKQGRGASKVYRLRARWPAPGRMPHLAQG